MSEETLDFAHAGAVVEHGRGCRVAQRVRVGFDSGTVADRYDDSV